MVPQIIISNTNYKKLNIDIELETKMLKVIDIMLVICLTYLQINDILILKLKQK